MKSTHLRRSVLLFVIACVAGATPALLGRQQGWDADTHGREATPDYDRVFDQSTVKRLDLQIAASDWDRILADMTDMAGPFGTARGGGAAMPVLIDPARIAACTAMVEGSTCSFGSPPQSGRCVQQTMGAGLACTMLGAGNSPPVVGNNPARGGGNNPAPGGGNPAAGRDDVELLPRTPIYVPATVTFDGVVFHNAGLRLKGNSSLVNSWRSGVEKLPWRVNFDELENQFPSIRDQTFFGFPNISLTNNSQDTSFLRAKVVGDLFRDAGLPAARTAFVRVYLDRGAGSNYVGVYTMVEVPGAPMLEAQFGSAGGNLYKPAGTGARWTVFDSESFPKKTNENDQDWTDVQEAIAVLNESRANPQVWRQRLEARFGVNGFLRWLAVNTAIGNWDAYGSFSPHNYYAYGSPRHRDRLFWIPWDHDLSLNATMGGGNTAPGSGTQPVDLFHNSVTAQWPLIRYLLDDPVYRAAYRQHVEEVLGTGFEPSAFIARLQAQHALIRPFVVGPEGEQPGRTFLDNPQQFTDALNSLVAYVQVRADGVRQALAANR